MHVHYITLSKSNDSSLHYFPRYMDDIPWIWEDLKAKGYAVMKSEDRPDIMTFNWGASGFKKSPFHHYFRVFQQAMRYNEALPKFTSAHGPSYATNNCYGAKRKTDINFDYLMEFLHKYKDRKFFTFTFLAQLTHQYESGMYNLEPYLRRSIRNMSDTGILNNTLLILFSDHGYRISSYASTEPGYFEARLPVVYLVFPKWWQEKYPSLYTNLKINSRRLTSNFDLYATLFDVVNENFLSRDMADRRQRGISLLAEVPPSRTCRDAGIPPLWCSCGARTPLDNTSVIVQESALRVLSHLNSAINRQPTKCVPFKLSSIVEAKQLHFDREDRKEKSQINVATNVLITIEVKPHGARFRSTVRIENQSKSNNQKQNEPIEKYVLDESNIERIGIYGNQSHCIDEVDKQLRPVCLCKDVLHIYAT